MRESKGVERKESFMMKKAKIGFLRVIFIEIWLEANPNPKIYSSLRNDFSVSSLKGISATLRNPNPLKLKEKA